MRKALIMTGLITGMILPVQSAYAQSSITWFSIKTVSSTNLQDIFSENQNGGLDISTTDFEGNTSLVKVNLGDFISNLGTTTTVNNFSAENPSSEFTIPSSTSSTVDQKVAGEFVAEETAKGNENAGELTNTIINTISQTSTDPNAGQNVAQTIVTEVTNNPDAQNNPVAQQVLQQVTSNSNVDSGSIISKSGSGSVASLF